MAYRTRLHNGFGVRVRAYGHLGSQFGYTTFVAYFPEYGVSLAMMFNRGCDGGAERAAASVGGAVADALLRHLGAPESEDRESPSDWRKKLERAPGDVHLLYRVAKLDQAQQKDEDAALRYQQILERDPEDRYGYRLEALFWTAAYDGLIGKRTEGLLSFISEHPEYAGLRNAYRMLARTYQRRGEMAEAAGAYGKAVACAGEDADFLNEYAWWVHENRVQSEYDRALRSAEAGTRLKPEAFYIWDTLAWVHLDRGERDEALAASRRALRLAPEKRREEMQESLDRIRKGCG